jgi:hypothetical protein
VFCEKITQRCLKKIKNEKGTEAVIEKLKRCLERCNIGTGLWSFLKEK